MPDSLLPKRSVFRFALPCLYRDPLWTAGGGKLGEEYELTNLAALEGKPGFASVRAAWSEEGLAVYVEVTGKKKSLWCRSTKPDESDGLQLWIDTRDVHNVHRASRFCHRFAFLPTGGGRRMEEPVAQWLPINRARAHPASIEADQLKVKGRQRTDGYELQVLVSAGALTGFDPAEYPRLGFNYAVSDRELGEQTLSAGHPMPYKEDCSLWATLDLVKS